MNGTTERIGHGARRQRLPGLDGLRAIAVMMVVFYHLCSQGAIGNWPVVSHVVKQGAFGVQIFFVLSGFLITWLLLSEESKTGAIDLRRFYFRRSLRILPPALCYLLVIALLTTLGVLTVGSRDLVYSAFFIRNAFGVGGSPEVAHYWSLGVEEQFYLTWPFFLLCIRGHTRLQVTTVVIVVLAAWRSWGIHFGATTGGAEALLLGCLLAQVRQRFPNSPLVWHTATQRVIILIVSIVVIAITVFADLPMIAAATWAQTLPVIACAAIVNVVVDADRGFFPALLNFDGVQWIGRLSYSLYLWQQLFCWSVLSGRYAPTWWPALVAASFGCASISYYGVEQKCLALRERLESRYWSTVRAHEDLAESLPNQRESPTTEVTFGSSR